MACLCFVFYFLGELSGGMHRRRRADGSCSLWCLLVLRIVCGVWVAVLWSCHAACVLGWQFLCSVPGGGILRWLVAFCVLGVYSAFPKYLKPIRKVS